MPGYILRRLLQAALVLFGVVTLVYFIIWVTGDPASVILPPDATAQQVQDFRHANGWDKPIPVQYASFIASAVRGNFGTSFQYHVAALPLVLERVPATLELVGSAVAWSVALGVPIGVLAAFKKGGWIDSASAFAAIVLQSSPSFWIGILLILLFSQTLGVLPAIGTGGPTHLVMPGLTLGAFNAALISRLLRSNLLDVRRMDFMRTARAKGLSKTRVMLRHGLPNALMPVLTILGLQVGFLLGGTVIVEQVFAYPGMGLLLLQSISNHDIPVVEAAVTMIAFLIVMTNLFVDLLYTVVDPRVRLA